MGISVEERKKQIMYNYTLFGNYTSCRAVFVTFSLESEEEIEKANNNFMEEDTIKVNSIFDATMSEYELSLDNNKDSISIKKIIKEDNTIKRYNSLSISRSYNDQDDNRLCNIAICKSDISDDFIIHIMSSYYAECTDTCEDKRFFSVDKDIKLESGKKYSLIFIATKNNGPCSVRIYDEDTDTVYDNFINGNILESIYDDCLFNSLLAKTNITKTYHSTENINNATITTGEDKANMILENLPVESLEWTEDKSSMAYTNKTTKVECKRKFDKNGAMQENNLYLRGVELIEESQIAELCKDKEQCQVPDDIYALYTNVLEYIEDDLNPEDPEDEDSYRDTLEVYHIEDKKIYIGIIHTNWINNGKEDIPLTTTYLIFYPDEDIVTSLITSGSIIRKTVFDFEAGNVVIDSRTVNNLSSDNTKLSSKCTFITNDLKFIRKIVFDNVARKYISDYYSGPELTINRKFNDDSKIEITEFQSSLYSKFDSEIYIRDNFGVPLKITN